MNIQQSIEKWMADGKPITVKIGLKVFGTTETRVYISRISKHFDIDEKWCEHNGKRFKTWRMPQKRK